MNIPNRWLIHARRLLTLSFLCLLAPGSEAQTTNPVTSFSYTITASGTQNITTYPNETFNWGVTATATETWYKTNTGTATWGPEQFYNGHNDYFPSLGAPSTAAGNATITVIHYDNLLGETADLSIDGEIVNQWSWPWIPYVNPTNIFSYPVTPFISYDIELSITGGLPSGDSYATVKVVYPTATNITSTTTDTASTSGTGSITANQGSVSLGSVNEPQPTHGGTLGTVSYSTTCNNNNVSLQVTGGTLYAKTSVTGSTNIPWSAQQTGTASLTASQGEVLITNSTLVAPNNDTTWTVSVNSPSVGTRMSGPSFYAHIIIMSPTIVTPPQSQSVFAGSNIMFTVAAGGTAPLSYRWQFNGTSLTDNAQITGSQSNVLTLASVTLGNSGT